MSDSNPGSQQETNAYQAPQYVSSGTQTSRIDPSQLHELSARVRVLRAYCSALGILSCLWGAFSLTVAVVSATAVVNSADRNDEAFLLLAELAFDTIAVFTLGVALLFRQVWAAWGVLVYVALTLVLNLIQLNVNLCLLVIVGLGSWLAISIVMQAARLRAEGVSPRAKLRNGLISD